MPFGALAGAVAVAALGAARTPPDASAPAEPRVMWFGSAGEAISEALAGVEAGVVAFGELHQTVATARIPSALHRFTADVFPELSSRLSQLVVETWMTTGRCGEAERAVTADVERTTRRPAQTESEIETLLRVAHERGVTPRILSISCADYQAMRGAGATVDYDRTLRVTARALEVAIVRALADVAASGSVSRGAPAPAVTAAPAVAAAPAPARGRLVAVYGGALHNDLAPEPELAAYSFAPRILAATLGRTVEIDLVVPEYAAKSAAIRAQPWWRLYQRARRPGAVVLIRRGARSFVVVFSPQPTGPHRRTTH